MVIIIKNMTVCSFAQNVQLKRAHHYIKFMNGTICLHFKIILIQILFLRVGNVIVKLTCMCDNPKFQKHKTVHWDTIIIIL